jgi:hypothetical protein
MRSLIAKYKSYFTNGNGDARTVAYNLASNSRASLDSMIAIACIAISCGVPAGRFNAIAPAPKLTFTVRPLVGVQPPSLGHRYP